MAVEKVEILTDGERFYDITDEIRLKTKKLVSQKNCQEGVLHLVCQHTSCGLLISENYDPTAKLDLENFLKHLAPRNLHFIQHTAEGSDDSPSHMKSALTHQALTLIVEAGEIVLGSWQGLFVTEFRDHPKKRTVLLKFIPEN